MVGGLQVLAVPRSNAYVVTLGEGLCLAAACLLGGGQRCEAAVIAAYPLGCQPWRGACAGSLVYSWAHIRCLHVANIALARLPNMARSAAHNALAVAVRLCVGHSGNTYLLGASAHNP